MHKQTLEFTKLILKCDFNLECTTDNTWPANDVSLSTLFITIYAYFKESAMSPC